MKLYVKVLSRRKTVCVRVGELRSVDSIKNQVMGKLKLSTSDEERLYRPLSATGELELMECDKTMQHYRLGPGSTLYLGTRISVSVTMVSSESDSDVRMDIHTSDSVQDVKRAIYKHLGLAPSQQRLVLRGRLVQDDGNVRDYHVQNDDKLFVIHRVCGFNISIRDYWSHQHIATLSVEGNLTIRGVKDMIEELKGISVNCRHLFFRNRILNDSKTLEYYGIGWGCTLKLEAHCQIFVRNLAGKTLTLDVEANDTVAGVRSMLSAREGIPQQQQMLLFKGKHLKDGTLREHGVEKGTTLELSLSLRGGVAMEVHIQVTTGMSFFVHIERDTTVLELKEKICDQQGFPVAHQKLIFAGRVMEDDHTMADYNIQMTTTLHLVVSQPGKESMPIPVTVRTNTGREFCCHVVLSDPIKTLMSTIEDVEGIPKNCQQLFFNGQALDCHRSLKDYDFNGTECAIYLDFKGYIRVFVKVLSGVGKYSAIKSLGKKITFSVAEEMSVSSLKRLIELRESIPAYFQTLIFNGDVMKDDQSLGEYAIVRDSIIHLWPEKLHPMELSITVMAPSQTRQLPKLNSSTRIVNVKRMLTNDVVIQRYQLFHGPTLLQNEKSLQDYMVIDGSELYFVPSDSEEIPIIVNIAVGFTLTKHLVKARKTDQMKVIKDRIRKVDISHESLDLYFSSMILDDNKTVDSYGISAACSLTAVKSGEIPISIKTRFAAIPIAIDPSKPVEWVMERISCSPELGIPLHKQRLLLHHILLSCEEYRHKTVRQLGISPGNTLDLVVTPEEMEIYICTPRGSTLTLVCPSEYALCDVKEVIEQREGVPVENQILPFTDEDKTLKECDIKPGTYLDIGFLSAVPIKATTEQQEKRERVIMQQQMQEMESNKIMFEMQLDSASNYIETKISNFKGELDQCQQQIRDLKQENRKLAKKLEDEKRKFKLAKKKLMSQTKVFRSESVPVTSKEMANDDSIISCVSEEEEADLNEEKYHHMEATDSSQDLKYTPIGEFVYGGKKCTFSCDDHGLKLHFPDQQLKVSVMSLHLTSNEYDLYDNAEIVSAVYRVNTSSPLPCPVTVEMQHCVHLRDDEDTNSLCFVKASSEGGPPYRFEVVQGGQFTSNERYGKIKVSQFSDYAIVRFFKRLCGIPAPLVCCYNVFKKENEVNTHYVYIAVTKDLASYIKYLKDSEYKDCIHVSQQEIDLDDEVSIDIEEATENLEHWKLTPMKTPVKISRDSVEKYSSGMCVPHIWLRVRLKDEESPQREDLKLTLTGISEYGYFVIECVPGITYTQRGSFESDIASPCSSIASLTSRTTIPDKPIFSEGVDVRMLSLIRFSDGQGKKELRIRPEMEAKWRELAKQLGFSPAMIKTFANSRDPLDEMLTEWLQSDVNSCWRKLIKKMDDANLKTPASDLTYALSKCPCKETSSRDY